MDLLKLVVFLSSGIGQFIIVALIIALILPNCLIPIYTFIVVIIFIVLLIGAFISLFKE
jgi:hypothetical protein